MTGYFLNNYARTGIGDFGIRLHSELNALGLPLEYEETSSNGFRFFRQLARAVLQPGPLVANIGLTTWGTSPVRNFLGFLGIATRGRLGGRTVVVLHNAIEVIHLQDSGYKVSSLGQRFAHFAVRSLSACDIVVVSQTLRAELSRSYGLSPSIADVVPCDQPGRDPEYIPPPEFRVVIFGYLAPYKGLTTVLEIARLLNGRIRLTVVGGLHRVLASNPQFRETLVEWREKATKLGIEVLGFLDEEHLREVFSKSQAALLPYTSTSGGSASFARVTSAGLPVIATELPEFEKLKSQGAGIITSVPTAEAMSQALTNLASDEETWKELLAAQKAFTIRHSWSSFARKLAEVVSKRGLQGLDSVRTQ